MMNALNAQMKQDVLEEIKFFQKVDIEGQVIILILFMLAQIKMHVLDLLIMIIRLENAHKATGVIYAKVVIVTTVEVEKIIVANVQMS